MITLAKLYENPSALNKVFLMKHLFNLKIIEGGFLTNHLNEFNMITIQLIVVYANFSEEVSDLLILCSFSERWNSLVIAVSDSISSSSNRLKIGDVIGVIISEEIQWKIIGASSILGNDLTMENRGRTKERGKITKNHGNSQGKSMKGRSKSKEKGISSPVESQHI
jgi:hypothetical protein